MPLAHPPAARQNLVEHLHGRRVADPYRWLEELDSAATAEWLARQDSFFAAHRDTWRDRDTWARLLCEAAVTSRVSAPVWRGERRFTERQLPGREQFLLYVTEASGDERVIIDPGLHDARGRTRLAHWRPSWEGRLIACQFAVDGADTTRLEVHATDGSGRVGEAIEGLRHSPVAWLPGGTAFYYVGPATEGAAGRTRVKLHRLGRPATEDEEVFGAETNGFAYYGLSIAPDGSRLAVSVVHGISSANDLWLASPWPEPARPGWRRMVDGTAAGSLASIRFQPDGTARLHTDREAPRGRILAGDPAVGDWAELVPEHAEDSLDDSALLSGPGLAEPLLLVLWSRSATSRLTIHRATDGACTGEVPLPGSGTVRALRVHPAGSHRVWFTYTDFGRPPSVHVFDARTGRTQPWHESGAAPGPAAGPALVTRRVSYQADDGTPVLMFLLSRDDLPPGRPRPALLTAYGGFGTPMRPGYSPAARAWAEAGGVFAVACVRGGGEHGSAWHAAGRGAAKSRSVDDFNNAAEWLAEQGWTSAHQLGATGTSNGGLLVTAAATRRPDLYAALAATGPLCDMARYERFGIGHTWTGEYGSATIPGQLSGLLAYSPYHQVRAGTAYPAVLICGADTDERTGSQHVRKMGAALQHATTSTRPVLIRRTPTGGHAQASASSAAELTTDVTAFLAHHTGLAAARPPEGGEV